MAGVEHNTEIDDLGKEFLPEGFGKKHPHVDALAVDRSKKAKVVPFDEWKDNTNTTDLKDFDTKKAKERSRISVIKDLKGIRVRTTSGEDAMIEEPERFLKYYKQQLNREDFAKIVDFDSFMDATRKVFNSDPSLPNLWENIDGRKTGLREIFNTDEVQKWIADNSDSFIIEYLMKNNNIERVKAKYVYSRLNPRQKSRVLRAFNKSTQVKIKKKPPRPSAGVTLISQKSQSGKVYSRRKPLKWNKMQETFILNNRSKGLGWVKEYYNRIFDYRTDSSISNKFYRVK